MAFTVEDGTGVDGANSFCDVEYADAYFTDRGQVGPAGDGTQWPDETADKNGLKRQRALVLATDFIDFHYRQLWQGSKTYDTGTLSWPRDGVYVDDWAVDNDEMPDMLLRATAELALRCLAAGAGSPVSLSTDLAARSDGVIERTVGPITTKYSAGATPVTLYRFVEALLAPLLTCSGGETEVLRA